jgi:hypothetical protein
MFIRCRPAESESVEQPSIVQEILHWCAEPIDRFEETILRQIRFANIFTEIMKHRKLPDDYFIKDELERTAIAFIASKQCLKTNIGSPLIDLISDSNLGVTPDAILNQTLRWTAEGCFFY